MGGRGTHPLFVCARQSQCMCIAVGASTALWPAARTPPPSRDRAPPPAPAAPVTAPGHVSDVRSRDELAATAAGGARRRGRKRR